MLKQLSVEESQPAGGRTITVPARPQNTSSTGAGTLTAIAFTLLSLVCYAAKIGKLLQLVVPLGCVLWAFLILRKRPDLYLRFALWTWFLAPFVRRIADYRCGFLDQNLILIAPILVSVISIFDLRPTGKSSVSTRQLLPFILCLGGVLFGTLIALYLTPSTRLLHSIFEWCAPLLFGLYIACHPERYEEQRKVILSTFLTALICLSIYGIYQYIVMPVWDVFWLTNVMDISGANTFGRAEPGMLRIWSTINAPGTFAIVLFTGMILFSFESSRWKLPAYGLALVCLALTLIRTAWLGFSVALVIVFLTAGLKYLHRFLIIFLLIAACVPLLNFVPGGSDLIHDRLQTFSNLKGDESYLDRQETSQKSLALVLSSPFGNGHMSETPIDNGVFDLFLDLGWPGGIAYLAGLALALGNPYLFLRCKDQFLKNCLAVAVALISMLLSGNSLIDLPGWILWLCIALYWTGARSSAYSNTALKSNPFPSKVPASRSPVLARN